MNGDDYSALPPGPQAIGVGNPPTARLFLGDCLETLSFIPSASIDAVVTDPPYALVSITKRFGKDGAAPVRVPAGGSGAYARASSGFMGKTWDTGETAFSVEFWSEVYRVLKPGGHVLAFGGTRTAHRLTCAIEDAGFEIRDMIAWLYGTGFPKSHNLDGDWQGWGTALKPALEPITVARKPLIGTMAANVLAHGVGALNIDGCRIGTEGGGQNGRSVGALNRDQWRQPAVAAATEPTGRWPANVIHDGSEEVTSAFPALGKSSGGGGLKITGKTVYGDFKGHHYEGNVGYGDSGSAARFFYGAKASKTDRGEGNTHPTVKPTALMRYLCRLITPPGGTVLDPFMGSGSTGKAALAEGFDFVGIEREPEYFQIAKRRIVVPSASVSSVSPAPPTDAAADLDIFA